ncbi:MAG: chitobiase/beta-hexosaminidase C-terminal domain-containing protein [Verrucomicrobia bacterium]|nr:chitobiase/beta-hexosaminidase C-terminal domain-containing protein [Verrucomicrobiota bacterium]
MKTALNARSAPGPRRMASPPIWFNLLLVAGVLFCAAGVRAQVVVKTIGGGPVVAGGPASGFANGQTLEQSQFNNPYACAIDANRNLFVADRDNGQIRRLDLSGDRATTYLSGLAQPVAVALDADNNLYVGCQGDGTVRMFDRFSNPISIVSGFANLSAIAIGGTNVFVTELGGALKKISPNGTVNVVTNGWAQPRGVAVMDDRTVAISENHAIRRLDLLTLRADYLAGTNFPGFTNGPAYLAKFNQPHQIARAPNGNLVVADRLNHRVRLVDANGLTTTLYGIKPAEWASDYPGWEDGSTEFAEAREPVGVAVAGDGTVYTTEVFYHLVRSVGNAVQGTNATNVVVAPVINPAGAATNNPVLVILSSSTPGAQLYWTIDDTLPSPANGTLYNGPFRLGTNGTLLVKAFKSGFLESEVASAVFDLTVATPVLVPLGSVANNPVTVTLTSATTGAELYWTIDGTEPTPTNGTLYTEPFVLAASGNFKVKGYRRGFQPSATVSAEFDFAVTAPKISPSGGASINSVTVELSSTTSGAELRYTLDGSAPSTMSALYAGPFKLTTNAVVTAVGFRAGFANSPAVSTSYIVQVDTPVMSPSEGFFPDGATVSFSVTRSDAKIYYTLNGDDPTLNDKPYSGPFRVFSLGSDLRAVRARAFAPNAEPSAVVSGQPVKENAIGLPRDVVAGIGSTIVLPVVVNLQTNTVLRSLQFRFEVSPLNATTPALTTAMRALDIRTNDFIPVAGAAEPGKIALYSYAPYAVDATSGLVISAIGTNANFAAKQFGTVALLAVPIPANAKPGDAYKLDILQPSGTSDGQQDRVELATMPSRTITVKNVPYLAGDSSYSGWYNAGDFGNGDLDNSDVNNAFIASLGVRVPFDFSDLFNAMDVFPDDTASNPGGDGQIRFLDWQRILYRSLRLSSNNWSRSWSAGGVRATVSTGALKGLANYPATAISRLPGEVWTRPALICAGSVANANPDSVVELPISVKVMPGASLSGLQFRVVLASSAGTPPIRQPISFVPALGVPAPRSLDGLPSDQVACAWSLEAFNPPLEGSTVLGVIRFRTPVNATFASCYMATFANADGSPDAETQYDFETRPGCAWIQTPVPAFSEIISVEWKTNFFGSAASPAADPMADPDQDGIPNWAEYLAGTNPTDAHSRLELLPVSQIADAATGGFKLRWLSAPGKSYVVECAPDRLGTNNWRAIASDIAGTGEFLEYIDPKLNHPAQFYRVRVSTQP